MESLESFIYKGYRCICQFLRVMKSGEMEEKQMMINTCTEVIGKAEKHVL